MVCGVCFVLVLASVYVFTQMVCGVCFVPVLDSICVHSDGLWYLSILHQCWTVCVCVFAVETGVGDQEEFVKVFFLMHQWFMTSEELAQAFIDLYPWLPMTPTHVSQVLF